MRYWMTGLTALCAATTAAAGEVRIVDVEFQPEGDAWRAAVTLRHADEGWEHYADRWRIVTPAGDVLGSRVLHHPHVNEQPFTRSLDSIYVPADTPVVTIEAHDTLHGWSDDRVRVDFREPVSRRYRILR